MTAIDIDLTLNASEEAKICLNCKKSKCTPVNCQRFKQRKKELKQGKSLEIEEEFIIPDMPPWPKDNPCITDPYKER